VDTVAIGWTVSHFSEGGGHVLSDESRTLQVLTRLLTPSPPLSRQGGGWVVTLRLRQVLQCGLSEGSLLQ